MDEGRRELARADGDPRSRRLRVAGNRKGRCSRPGGTRARDPVSRHLPRDADGRLEFARHLGGIEGANSTEMDPETPYRSSTCSASRRRSRTSAGPCASARSPSTCSRARRRWAAYAEPPMYERHRHRYEVNNHFRPRLVEAGWSSRGPIRKADWSKWWSFPTIRGSWQASFIRSSSPGRPSGSALPGLHGRRARRPGGPRRRPQRPDVGGCGRDAVVRFDRRRILRG